MWFKGGGGGAGITVARAIWYPFQGSIIVLSQHRLLGTGRGGGGGGGGKCRQCSMHHTVQAVINNTSIVAWSVVHDPTCSCLEE